jgi:hypothetical protein
MFWDATFTPKPGSPLHQAQESPGPHRRIAASRVFQVRLSMSTSWRFVELGRPGKGQRW